MKGSARSIIYVLKFHGGSFCFQWSHVKLNYVVCILHVVGLCEHLTVELFVLKRVS